MAQAAGYKLGSRPIGHWINNSKSLIYWVRGFLDLCGKAVLLSALGAISYVAITHFLFESVTVNGPSMFPTLKNSDCYWLNRFTYIGKNPRQFDIVALKEPRDGTLIVKRIIATPGQSVYLYQGRVYVDGKLLVEPYLPDKTPTYAYEKSENELFCVGKNDYFVMGDNRNNSTDSRTFGTVPRKNILGKVMD